MASAPESVVAAVGRGNQGSGPAGGCAVCTYPPEGSVGNSGLACGRTIIPHPVEEYSAIVLFQWAVVTGGRDKAADRMWDDLLSFLVFQPAVR